MSEKVYDCSYWFDEKNIRKKYKYIIISKGDLDLNGAMMLKNIRDVEEYLKECGEFFRDRILAIIKINSFLDFSTTKNFRVKIKK